MQNKELQVRTLFERMLKDTEEYARTYEHYAKDMKRFKATVQWKIGPISGYQVFKQSEYSHEIDKEIESPDILIECDDLIIARQFFRNEFEDMRALAKVDFEISSPRFGRKPGTGNSSRKAGALVGMLPPFRKIMSRQAGTEHSSAVVIPINESLGSFRNEILPVAVVEYFVNKASHIFLYDNCPCRDELSDCQNYPHDLGCMILGRGVLRMKSNIEGRLATKEEALERAKKAVEAGLIVGFGRLRGDAINRIGGPLPDTGDLFNLCYCCPCCCVVGGIKYAPSYLRGIFQKFEGLEITIEEETCNDCGDCVDVCIYGALEMRNDELERDMDKCFGCGRCVTACTLDALEIELEEGSVERMIARIEAHVDVT
jgi:UDP-glucose 4-epimerase